MTDTWTMPTPQSMGCKPLTRPQQDAFANLWKAKKMKYKPRAEREELCRKVYTSKSRVALCRALMPKQTKKQEKEHKKNRRPLTKPQIEREAKQVATNQKRSETMKELWAEQKAANELAERRRQWVSMKVAEWRQHRAAEFEAELKAEVPLREDNPDWFEQMNKAALKARELAAGLDASAVETGLIAEFERRNSVLHQNQYENVVKTAAYQQHILHE
ncbi:hypothetical protein [Ruegeria sp. HKCCD6119]|uniref:hypothetical protein n=1 Tax=Ruegeria sp. HKCCD6119 TaxID=2683003 RepID=UPI001490D720|nr:hypothetical protein [Ruegeria sp. HKCCD6119]NOD83755.1 hypothetical protein [Ruegeria sp. HKCCD6119]